MNQEQIRELERQAGFGGGGFTTYKTLQVDNGSDLAGTGATGDFIEKVYDKETKTVNKEKVYAASGFPCVILLSRAIVSDKGRTKSWLSSEFNPLLPKEKIALYKLKDGKIEKDQLGNKKIFYATYDEIKQKNSTTKVDGSIDRQYDFFYVLYVQPMHSESIYKIRVKGTGKGHFIEYSKKIKEKGLSLFSVNTFIYSVMDPYANYKYQVFFKLVTDEEGNPARLGEEKTKEALSSVGMLLEAEDEKNDRLALPSNQASLPSTGQAAPEMPRETAANPVTGVTPEPQFIELDDVEPEINIEDIPFN